MGCGDALDARTTSDVGNWMRKGCAGTRDDTAPLGVPSCALSKVIKHFHGFVPHLGEWLVDRRQWRLHIRREDMVIETNERDIVWNANARWAATSSTPKAI